MPKPAKRKSGHVTLTATHRAQGLGERTSVEEFLLQAMDVGENPASVNYAVGLNHNLGNYENLRISVGVTLPTRTNTVYQAGEVAKRIAHDMLDRSMTEWVGPDAGRRSPHAGEQEDDEFADA